MFINGKNYDLIKKASKGTRFVSESSFALFGGNLNQQIRKEKIKTISEEILELLKKKESITIPIIMKSFHINAIDAIEAIELLRVKGMIQETESTY